MTDHARISDHMIKDVVTLTPNMEINRAMNILLERKISGAPVVDETGQLLGVLSKKDCLKAALNASYFQEWGDTVANYMSTDVKTLDADMDIVQAAEVFLASTFRRFPMLREGQLVGQISRTDILAALSQQWR